MTDIPKEFGHAIHFHSYFSAALLAPTASAGLTVCGLILQLSTFKASVLQLKAWDCSG